MQSIFGPSWRIKFGAVLAAVSVACGQIATLVDDKPETNPDISVLISLIGALGAAFSARDNMVTSEQAKAKR